MVSEKIKKTITEQTAAYTFMNQIGLNISQGFQPMVDRLQKKWNISNISEDRLIQAADHFFALEIVLGLATVKTLFENKIHKRLTDIILDLTQQRSEYLCAQNKNHDNLYMLVLDYEQKSQTFVKQQRVPIQEFCKIILEKLNIQTHVAALEMQTYLYVHFTGIEVWKGMFDLFDIRQDANTEL